MTARKRLREIQLAKSQRIQEAVHRVLYCDTDWGEAEIYGQRFKRILERSKLNELPNEIDEDVIKEFKRRVEKKLKGSEVLDKSLPFYRILITIGSRRKDRESIISKMETRSEQCIDDNLSFLEKSGYLEREGGSYRLSPMARKLILKQK